MFIDIIKHAQIRTTYNTSCPLRPNVSYLVFLGSSASLSCVSVGLSPPEHSPVVEAEIPDTRVIQSKALLAPTERPLQRGARCIHTVEVHVSVSSSYRLYRVPFLLTPKNNAIENSNYGSKKIENQFLYLNILGSFKKYISIKWNKQKIQFFF